MPLYVRLLIVVSILFISVPASAVPVTYGFTAGTITIQATQNSDNQLVFNETLPLSAASFLTWDAAGSPGFGLGTLDDFLLRVVPNQGPYSTLISYGYYDQVTIDSADITPDLGLGYSTIFSLGGSIQVAAIDIDAYYSASNCVSCPPGYPDPSPSTVANIEGITPMSATLSFAAGAIQLSAFGIVMGTVDGTPFGEAGNDLNLTANITFFGDSFVVPAPEPSTGLMVGLGLVGMAMVRRNRFTA